MFGSSKTRTDVAQERVNDRVDTVIGAGTSFVGDIQVKGTLRIDGKCQGKIDSSGDVIVGEGGAAECVVQARNAKVSGLLKGNLKVTGTLEITETGKMLGDIEVGKIIISDGAVFQGQCIMKNDAVPKTGAKE